MKKNRSLQYLFVLFLLVTAHSLFAKTHHEFEKPLKSSWTVMIYAAADNSLSEYALKDIQEMAKVGSNENVTIIVQLDELGEKEKTKRLLIKKGSVENVGALLLNVKLDSGDAQTLIDFCKWGIDEYPAEHYALVLWNHGSGVLDPAPGRSFNVAELFIKNPSTYQLEVDRSISFIEWIRRRGICFSDTRRTYLNNQDLMRALNAITDHLGRKIDVIAFDACLMAMIEIIDTVRFYADYMVASQEVEPGDGWHYEKVLEKLSLQYMTPREFAEHAVESYRQEYLSQVPDFTQSAVDLRKSHGLIDNIHRLATLLLGTIDLQVENTVTLAIETSKDRKNCTSFSEPSYIDLSDFYYNLRMTLPFMQLEPGHKSLIDQLGRTLDAGIELIKQAVIANVCGKNLAHAGGISIYFPKKSIDASYEKTYFSRENAWGELLHHFN